ncbi:Histone deacetylase domain protein [Kalmanozyma brasiliensis GHG001]|nr:Histone deacetylase domain protein [Kalmanozyma brasiliensis GHG001]EST08158.2 Histone deacetylase domain protein [Kalmanozyma brasiliensis GHG001]
MPPSQEGIRTDAQAPPLPASASASNPVSNEAQAGRSEFWNVTPSNSHTVSTANTAAPNPAHSAAELDVLLAPSVLNHRYVRGVDKSLIVERPERIRAVLLGIATAIGKSSTTEQHPPLPTSVSNNAFQTSPTPASRWSGASASDASVPPLPFIKAPAQGNDDDDLVARLNSLSVQGDAAQATSSQTQQKFRVLHSTRSLPLDPPHPAVAFAHAHSDELVTVLESAYDQAKQKRRDARAAIPEPLQIPAANLSNPSLSNPDHAKAEREATPTPSSIMTDPQQQQKDVFTGASTPRTSHAAYLEYLCSRAPNHPPFSHRKPQHSSPSKAIPEDSEAYTSSDGEGDDAMHVSEVPEHLPQGDLYLAGPSKEGSLEGGSAEAIRHAMGACCEAVDRVVWAAASASSGSQTPTALKEITYEGVSQPDSSTHANPPPAKRAFVLSRPPGHHCSGSTPQGFCWVNNAIVAAAHAYLTHAVDRVVIFDIDLHHGNGTQNLAWRINADANKHDDQRAERISSLRAAALERARQAVGSGSGRAHASRIAKVALSEQDETEVKRQAGPRALRLFYSSLHDIESFPCEDGDPSMIKDASTCVEGAHGQWIWNIHLDHYRSESDFKRLYDDKYKILFSKAARFLLATSATPQSTLILISAGFDACAYEYPGMQRHGKHVPPSFYHTFARDAVDFADAHGQGKLVSVLEGGYSDRALCSAALAHVTGLAVGSTASQAEEEAEYWKLENLIAVEKVAKKMAAHAAAAVSTGASGAASTNTTPKRRQAELAPWLSLTSKAFAAFEQACGKDVVPLNATATPSRAATAVRLTADTSAMNSPAGRVLRTRKSRANFGDVTTTPQARRAASPTKPTPARGAGVLAKKESPARARAGAGPFGAPVTPVKIEVKDEGDMSMDTDTPTRTSAGVVVGANLSSPVKIGQTTDDVAQETTPQAQQAPQQPSHTTDPTDTGVTHTTAISEASSATGNDSPSPHKRPAHISTHPPPPTNYIGTASTPQSPMLTSAPVTLVDALSAPQHRVVDANTAHYASADVLGLDFLRAQAFQFANGEAGEEDAPGSPDPDVPPLEGGAVEGYFPPVKEDRAMPGGLGTFSGMNLDQATLQRVKSRDSDGGKGLYPHLPGSFASPGRRQ